MKGERKKYGKSTNVVLKYVYVYSRSRSEINPLLLRPQNIGVRPAGLMVVLIVLIIEE